MNLHLSATEGGTSSWIMTSREIAGPPVWSEPPRVPDPDGVIHDLEAIKPGRNAGLHPKEVGASREMSPIGEEGAFLVEDPAGMLSLEGVEGGGDGGGAL